MKTSTFPSGWGKKALQIVIKISYIEHVQFLTQTPMTASKQELSTSSSSLSLGFSSEVCLTKSGIRISSVARAAENILVTFILDNDCTAKEHNEAL